MTLRTSSILLLLLVLFNLSTKGQSKNQDNYLVLYVDTSRDEYGYKDQNGDIAIKPGKYSICFTDTFRTYAIVLKPTVGFIAINRQENILYKVFPFDNGPDYSSNGLFRILRNNKIGYADSETGRIIIKPQFECAFPFENGIAKVSYSCKMKSTGEHTNWTSLNWLYINKKGIRIKSNRLTN